MSDWATRIHLAQAQLSGTTTTTNTTTSIITTKVRVRKCVLARSRVLTDPSGGYWGFQGRFHGCGDALNRILGRQQGERARRISVPLFVAFDNRPVEKT